MDANGEDRTRSQERQETGKADRPAAQPSPEPLKRHGDALLDGSGSRHGVTGREESEQEDPEPAD